ncbi:MAG: hypothetical protein QM775_00345 [Pirellulales bacterium]
MQEWTKEEQQEWNMHANVMGIALAISCAPRLIGQFQRVGLSAGLGSLIEGVIALTAMILSMRMVFARHKKTRDQVPEFTNSLVPCFTGLIVATAYTILLFRQAALQLANGV